jgi:peptidyl-prolyl cis-trans isomerase D
MLAYTSSDDSSSQQGGDLGYFGPNQMVKPFNDFVFNNSVGKIGLVETDFGFHVIQIGDKQDGVRLATIAQKIEASEQTSDKTFTQATKFEMDAANKDFEKLAKEMKITLAPAVTSKIMDESLGALGNQRNIVRWAFDKETNVGDVKRFEIPNLGHVIAKVKKANEEGLMTAEAARPSVEPILRNKKKAELLKAKMTASSLEAIAKANATTVQQAVGVTMENPSVSTGQEPKVIGNAFALAPNKISAPIEGNSGVYVVKNTSVSKAPALKDFTPYIAKLKAQSAGDSNRVIPALKADAKIVDNRSQFNY